MIVVQVPLKGVNRPVLLGSYILSRLSAEKLSNQVFLIREGALIPIHQFSFIGIEGRSSSVDLLIGCERAEETVQSAVDAFRDEAFDSDGYLNDGFVAAATGYC